MTVTVDKRLISVIIPTLNEQSGIEETISSIPKSYISNKLGYEIEIIVVDGQSTDSTRRSQRRRSAALADLQRRPGLALEKAGRRRRPAKQGQTRDLRRGVQQLAGRTRRQTIERVRPDLDHADASRQCQRQRRWRRRALDDSV